MSRYGRISMLLGHKWYMKHGHKMTPYLQDMMLWASQNDNYQCAVSCLERFLRLDADDSQLHRLVADYGEILEGQAQELSRGSFLDHAVQTEQISTNEVVYAMADGCQLPTRPCLSDGSWKEMKLGRLFFAREHLEVQGKPNSIRRSGYVAHFGGHKGFTEKFGQVVDLYEKHQENLVFINDGAKWIDDWIKTDYPHATNILDFYHAVEYLHDFAKVFYGKGEEERAKRWVCQHRDLLKNDEVKVCIEQIGALQCKGRAKKEAKDKILTYYSNNQDRMYYKTYRERGLLIGSGPIEAAHRFVVQKRMKQSGQKWTRQGGQRIVNLRVAYLNQQWDKVVQIIKSKAA